MRILPLLLLLALGACASGEVDAPKLGYRSAEAIDPRLPVGREDPAPGELTMGGEIAALKARAMQGAAQFEALEGDTVAAVGRAAAPGSESWTQAQQLLSRLDAARRMTALALADIDALATDRMAGGGWVSPADRSAIEAATREVGALNARQSALIDRLAGALGD